jgi:hypothetical protein
VFDVQWSDCPVEVEEEVRRLWRWQELGKNTAYFRWDRISKHDVCVNDEDDFLTSTAVLKQFGEIEDDEFPDLYTIELRHAFPLIDQFLMSRGVDQCLIHWLW